MKRLMMSLVLVLSLVLTLTDFCDAQVPVCENIEVTNLGTHSCGRFIVTELEFYNGSPEEVKAVVVGVVHISSLGKLTGEDIKLIWADLQPGKKVNMKITNPIPKGTAVSSLALFAIVGADGVIVECMEE